MPIAWHELETTEPSQFHLRQDLDRLQADPWHEATPFDLTDAIAAVDQLIEEQQVELPEFDRFGRT
jgi:DNA primase